jgi:HPt (histidine-containing phosphotransfer) domain-containing protein
MSDIFAERVAAVRQRFAAKLDARIDVIASAMPRPDGEVGLPALALAHREAHGLCGVGQTLGFVETGKVARSIEQVLVAAVRTDRTLTDDEISRLREGIALLRSTATAEMASAGQE